jgi:ribosomal protein S18 acetylase RimI-like enzyme
MRSMAFKGMTLIKRYALSIMFLTRSSKMLRDLLRRSIGAHVNYRVATPIDIKSLLLFYDYNKNPNSDILDAQIVELLEREGRMGYAFIASFNGKIVGAAVLRCFPNDAHIFQGWWLFEIKVHPLLGGSGIGEHLVSMALEKANKMGALSLNLLTSKKNYIAIGLYKKVGFEHIAAKTSSLQNILDQEGNQRIVLSKPIHYLQKV